MEITLNHYLSLSAALFAIGIFGLISHRKSLIGILLALEILLLAVNINFVAFSAYHLQVTGQIFSLFVLAIAAAESAIGLAILLVYYRTRRTIDLESLTQLRG